MPVRRTIAGPPSERLPSGLGRRYSQRDPLPQKVVLELHQGDHQVGDQLALRRREVERQPGLRDQRDVLAGKLAQSVHQVLRRAPPPGELGHRHCVDLAGLRQRHRPRVSVAGRPSRPTP